MQNILIYENKQDKMVPHVVWDEHEVILRNINYVTLFRGEGMGWGKAKCYIVLYYRRQGGVGQRYMTHNYYSNVKFLH